MSQPTHALDAQKSLLSRRTVFAGVGAVGAAATAAAVLPGVMGTPTPTPPTSAKNMSRDGYQLTDHVQRYYQTAKI